MGNHNSLETYVSLWFQLYHDIAQCYPTVDCKRELSKIRSRLLSEGLSFLTKTLPKVGKAIDLALHNSKPLNIVGLTKRRQCALPNLFGWLLEQVFDTTGYVKAVPNVTALRHIRQLVYFLYKLDVPYDSNVIKTTLESFSSIDQALGNFQLPDDSIIRYARILITRVFSGFNPMEITPRHGPGAVATGEESGDKSNFSRIYTHLDKVFPFCEYFTLGDLHVADQYKWIQTLEVLEEATAKVALVPKDSRGPRLISAEPLEIQWIQQGLLRAIVPWVERHRLTSGHVNFTDQNINRSLALSGSLSGRIVTLDMKDASDRVSTDLVKTLFGGTTLLRPLLASRSSSTRLPDGRLVTLNKFASMGSAVCFPVEALCFWALAVAALRKHGRTLRHCLSTVYVYGDDIIVDGEDYPILLQHFPRFGLVFNSSKCCLGGFFRESCGCDAYKGVDVTPIRMRTRWSHRDILDASELSSYVALSNAMYARGYWGVSERIRSMVTSRYGQLPFKPEQCETVLGWSYTHANHHEKNKMAGIRWRYSRHLHRLEYYSWVTYAKTQVFAVDGWRECLRVLNTGSTGSNTGVYALPRRSCLKRGWRAIY